MKSNFHTHTTFCDGRDTPEAMVDAAVERGFDVLGFSSHSDMLRDPAAYRAAIRDLVDANRGRLLVMLGLEAELAKPWSRVSGEYDYVIGSCHFITAPDGGFFPFDHAPQILADGIRDHFGGDAAAFVKAYFALVRSTLSADFEIVGHPDLVRKFNAKHPFFDESAGWYREELEATADAIAASGKLVEINTGAISRGWLNDAYPSPEFRAMLRERGVRFVLSSDAHSADALDCAFDRFGGEDFVSLQEVLG